MRTLPVLLIILSLFTACTTANPPRIENSYYINPSYEYSFKLPFNWVQTDKLPEFLGKAIPTISKQKIIFILFNNDTNGIMYLSNAGTVSGTKAMSNEQILRALIVPLEKKVETYKEQPSVANVNLKTSYQTDCFSPCSIASIDAEIENEFLKLNTLERTFIYPCHGNDTCVINVGLISLEEKYKDNFEVFKETLRSLQKHREHAKQ